jgi:hypothetical protein
MGMGEFSTMSTLFTLCIVLFFSMTFATTKGGIFSFCVGTLVVHELKQNTTITKKTT